MQRWSPRSTVSTTSVSHAVVSRSRSPSRRNKFRAVELRFPEDTSGPLATNQAKNWNNTVNFHAGAEGILTDNWMLRGGILVDPSPSPASTLTPDVPDATRVNLALGGTYRTDTGFHVDVGYQLIFLTSKTSTAPQLTGDYGGLVNILGLSLGYTTPRARAGGAAPIPEPTQEAPEPAAETAPSSTSGAARAPAPAL